MSVLKNYRLFYILRSHGERPALRNVHYFIFRFHNASSSPVSFPPFLKNTRYFVFRLWNEILSLSDQLVVDLSGKSNAKYPKYPTIVPPPPPIPSLHYPRAAISRATSFLIFANVENQISGNQYLATPRLPRLERGIYGTPSSKRGLPGIVRDIRSRK